MTPTIAQNLNITVKQLHSMVYYDWTKEEIEHLLQVIKEKTTTSLFLAIYVTANN